MGTNNLSQIGAARTLAVGTQLDQYFNALQQNIVPRNSSGVPTNAAGDLGSSSYKFKDLYLSGSGYIDTSLGVGTSFPETKLHVETNVSGTDTEQGGIKHGGTKTRIIPLRGPAHEMLPWSGVGGHGGGDKVLLDDIFLPEKVKDKYLRAADQRAGAYSILTGIAANKCFETGKTVSISELVSDIGYPAYPEMPSRTADLPMPGKEA